MKKITGLYKKYMVRPILYKTVTRFTIALAAALLWNRWVNTGHMRMLANGFFAAGMIVMLFTWFSYLRLDGIRVHLPPEKKEKKKKHRVRDIIDFVDEKIVPFDELQSDEQNACRFAANLITALIMIVTSLVMFAINI